MSKDTDKDAADAGTHRTRRRRKKSGLRIPSDNVPRTVPMNAVDPDGETTDKEQTTGVVAPVPEDPNVAVSVAYAFSATDAESKSAKDKAGDGADTSAGKSAGGDAGAGSSAAETGEADEGGEDVDLELPTAKIPVVAKADGSPKGKAGRRRVEEDFDSRRTIKMEAIRLEDIGLSEDDVEEMDGDDDGVDIDIDEAEPEDSPAQSSGVVEMVARAATVALSDEDLEELIEPMDMRSARIPRRPRAVSELLGDDTRSTQPLKPIGAGDEGGTDNKRASRKKPRTMPPEPGVPAAVAALEEAGIESPHDSPVVFGDAGDSGEILSDDLIEEVDDSDVEVTDGPRKAPPPAPTGAPSPPKTPPPAPKAKSTEKPKVNTQSKQAKQAKAKRRKGKPWFEEIFDEDYLRTLPFLTPQATQSEAAFVASALELEPGSQILDVGCGYGRHAMELAARGFQVVALDMSLPLLLRGADEAQRRGLNINFVHGDMRDLSFEDQFDGAYCLFSTFGYFDEDANKKTARGIARALRPGARLVIEILNRDYLIADLPARVWWEGDGCVVLEEVDFNYFSSRVMSRRSVVFDDGRQLEQEISLRAYSLHEFGKLLSEAGFKVTEVSGSMAIRGRFFGNQSRAIIVVAEKRPEETPAVHDPAPVHQFPRAGTATETSPAE